MGKSRDKIRTDIAAVTGLILYSDCLLSKWGFGDGDEPDEVYDHLNAIDPTGAAYRGLDWHAVLIGLVRDFLLPAIEQDVVVYEINTNHNPIRAESVDGQEVDATLGRDQPFTLTPESVTVPWDEVRRRVNLALPQ